MISTDSVFYDLKPSPDGKAAVDWQVRADLPYLDGHFPGTPILPAIAMVDASMHLLQKVKPESDLRLKSVALAKFMSPIVPGQKLRIEWKFVSESSVQLEWKERADNRLLASLTLEFGG